MKRQSVRFWQLIVLGLLLLAPAGLVQANEWEAVPEEQPMPLFQHWLFDRPGGSQWMAFLFYRPGNCVPGDHNLCIELDFRALFLDKGLCPYLVDGFSIVEEPGGFPKQAKLWESTPMPIWFADAAWFYTESADGELLMSELRALQGSERLMKGAVRNLNWTLHPFPGPAHTVVFSVSAQGVLNDGNDTPFSLHASHVITDPPSPPTVVRSVVFNLQVRN